jgi:hypothetical protein
VLHDVEQEDDVVFGGIDGQWLLVEVVEVERVELDAVREREQVDSGDVAADLPKPRAELPAGTAEIEDAAPGLEDVERERVWAVERESRDVPRVTVVAVDVELAVVEEAEVLGSRSKRVPVTFQAYFNPSTWQISSP